MATSFVVHASSSMRTYVDRALIDECEVGPNICTRREICIWDLGAKLFLAADAQGLGAKKKDMCSDRGDRRELTWIGLDPAGCSSGSMDYLHVGKCPLVLITPMFGSLISKPSRSRFVWSICKNGSLAMRREF